METKTGYYVMNEKTGMFFKRFEGNKPLWTKEPNDAVYCEKRHALQLRNRLENLYAPSQKIVLVL